MILPLSIATLGLHPGHTTFNCATLGYGFHIVIEVGPGGSDLEVYDLRDSRRVVTVTIIYKNRSWKQTLLVESITIDRVLKVVGHFRSLKQKTIEVIANVKASIRGIVIKATPK